MSSFDLRQRVRDVGVPAHYVPLCDGAVQEGEETRCFLCGLYSHHVGTLVYVWERIQQHVTPPHIDLCEFCHQAAREQL